MCFPGRSWRYCLSTAPTAEWPWLDSEPWLSCSDQVHCCTRATVCYKAYMFQSCKRYNGEVRVYIITYLCQESNTKEKNVVNQAKKTPTNYSPCVYVAIFSISGMWGFPIQMQLSPVVYFLNCISICFLKCCLEFDSFMISSVMTYIS